MADVVKPAALAKSSFPMPISETRIDSIAALHDAFSNRTNIQMGGFVFRGHSDHTWPLRPKAGREDYSFNFPGSQDDCLRDLVQFGRWLDAAYPFADELPTSQHEALAFAQHHGLATRLLDWTGNALVAAFFAARENPKCDGAVYCYLPRAVFNKDDEQSLLGITQWLASRSSGLKYIHLPVEHGKLVRTRALDARMLNQRGVFTIHCPPEKTLDDDDKYADPDDPLSTTTLGKFIIPAGFKAALLDHLDDYGVNDSFVFPDVDGVARSINWETRKLVRTRPGPGTIYV